MRAVSDRERRDRLGARHALAAPVDTAEQAVEAMTCLHATEPASVHLSAFVRTGAPRDDLDRALYEDRTVVKQLAMRRTLFTFPRDLLPAVWGSASDRVAGQLHARLAKDVVAHGFTADGERWLGEVSEAVLGSLAEHGPSTTAELRERIPELSQRLDLSPGRKWAANVPVASRVLSTIGAGGRIVRGVNGGDWHTSRARWTLTEDWLGEPVRPLSAVDGYRVLVERWLRTFGPGTEADLVWWLGATKGVVRRALGELGAVEVALSDGTGYLLPDDLDDPSSGSPSAPWAALLPVLDPTTMGWRDREFYLADDDVPHLFDRNGNAGTTAWWDGRIVGCWVQDPDGVVSVVLLHDVGAEATRELDAAAARLTTWLDGHRVGSVYTSSLMKSGSPG